MSLRRIAALCLGLLAAACASAPTGAMLAAPAANDPPAFRAYIPQGGKPHPGVLLVPGCTAPLMSARAAVYERYATKLRDEGFAAAIVAYPGAGMGDPACQNVSSPDIVAADIAAALVQLRATPGVDPTRLHIVGWSWGARGVLETVMARRRLPGLVSAVAFYPPCPRAAPWNSMVTLQLFLGEKDTVTSAAVCRAWADKSDGPGPVAITRYVGVGHGFDIGEAGDPRFATWQTNIPIVFDASTSWQAWQDLLKFLRLPLPAA